MSQSPDRPSEPVSSPAGRVSIRPLRSLLPFVRQHSGRVAASFVALLVASMATLVLPIAIRRVIDHGFTTEGSSIVDRYFLAMIAVAAVLALASAARLYLVTTLGERIVADIRASLFAHLLTLSASFYDMARPGELVSRLTSDTVQIKLAFGAGASIALRNAVLLSGAVTMMIVTSPLLSALVLLVIPLIVLPLIAFGRVVRRRGRVAQDRLADTAAFAAEMIGGARTVQAFTAEPAAAQRFADETEAAFDAARASIAARALLTATLIFIVASAIVCVLWYGANDVIAGRMTPGTLGQFVLYAVFAATSLGQLSQVWGEILQASGAAERISELLGSSGTIKPPATPRLLPLPVRGEIVFDRVRFAYPSHPQRLVLHDLSFSAAPGETVAIVGPSGAGKSTIFHLLLRFYDPDAGTISLDRTPIDTLALDALRSNIALVAQDTLVFAASVRDNIGFGRAAAGPAAIEEAARMASAEVFLQALPQGFDTMLGERGVTLSGGQRQRLALARAILKDAPVLLLDEATSALDAEAEAAVQDALRTLSRGRTTLVVAHRLATVLAADRILVLDQGRIVEQGRHAELVARGGLYARLAELQFRTGVEAA